MNKTHILLLTLISLFHFALTASGQERYTVEARTLNVRSGPNIQGLVIHTLHQGDIVEVHQHLTDWSQVSYHDHIGWVAQRYLRKLPQQASATPTHAKAHKPWLDLHDPKVLYWCILLLLPILPAILLYLGGVTNAPTLFKRLFALSILAIWAANVHYFHTIPRANWFFKDPSWYKVVGNFFLYISSIGFLCIYSYTLLKFISSPRYSYDEEDRVDIRTSSIGIVITCIIIYLLDWLLKIHMDLLYYIIIGFILYQLYQTFKQLPFIKALLHILVYSFCFSCLLLIGYYCIVPVLILGFILFYGHCVEDSCTSSTSSSGSSSGQYSGDNDYEYSDDNDNEDTSYDSYNPDHDGSFYIDGRYGRTKVTPVGGGSLRGDDGYWYYKDDSTGEYVAE